MSKKVRIELDFDIKDKVVFVTEEEELPVPGIITRIILTEKEAIYIVSRGFDERECYAFELTLAEVTK
jgi:hypothetical protein